jgi:tyrosyl-tRNA synthetase
MKDGEIPEDLPQLTIQVDNDLPIAALLNKAQLVKNSAAAKNFLETNAVKVDGQTVGKDFICKIGSEHLYQAGKKSFAQIKLEKI